MPKNRKIQFRWAKSWFDVNLWNESWFSKTKRSYWRNDWIDVRWAHVSKYAWHQQIDSNSYSEGVNTSKWTLIFVSISNSFALSRDIGHFTQIVYDRSNRIGCAISQYKESRKGHPKEPFFATLLVCNFAGQQITGSPVYKTGKPASGCKTGKNPKYPNLCNTNEQI